jgi:hypothetical protein
MHKRLPFLDHRIHTNIGKCDHGPLEDTLVGKKYLNKNSDAWMQLQKIVTDRTLLEDMRLFTKFM